MAWEWETGRLDEYRGLEFLGLGQSREDEKMRRRRDQENWNENGGTKIEETNEGMHLMRCLSCLDASELREDEGR